MSRVPSVGVLALLSAGCGTEPSGQTDLAASSQSIVGGYVDAETRGVVGLGVELRGRFFAGHCSGTLIAPNLVLTARHCVALTNEEPDQGVVCGQTAFVVQGDASMFLASPETERPASPRDRTFFRGSEIRAVPGASDICGYDIALIILEGAGIPAELATPIVPRIDQRPTSREVFSATGFGLTAPEGTADGVRMRTDGNTVRCAGNECGARIGRVVKETEWLSTDAQVCPGDSGGPALDSRGRVIGVASRGTEGCGSVIYGDVAAWGDFIIDVALEAAELGGYDAPFWTRGTSLADLAPDAGEADLLGRSCDGPCGGGYECWSATGVAPGICVPPCAEDADCGEGYACHAEHAVCVPDEGTQTLGSESACGVASASRPAPRAPWAFAGLAIGTWLSRRRRRVASRRTRSGGSAGET